METWNLWVKRGASRRGLHPPPSPSTALPPLRAMPRPSCSRCRALSLGPPPRRGRLAASWPPARLPPARSATAICLLPTRPPAAPSSPPPRHGWRTRNPAPLSVRRARRRGPRRPSQPPATPQRPTAPAPPTRPPQPRRARTFSSDSASVRDARRSASAAARHSLTSSSSAFAFAAAPLRASSRRSSARFACSHAWFCLGVSTGNSPSEVTASNPSPRGQILLHPRPHEGSRGELLPHPRPRSGIKSPRGFPSPRQLYKQQQITYINSSKYPIIHMQITAICP